MSRLSASDHRAHDRETLGLVVRCAHHEAAVDLDRIEPRSAEIAERGIACAEIVERQLDAQPSQLVQDLERSGISVDEHAFGHFQLQPPRLQAALGKRRHHGADKAGMGKLLGRDIDRDPYIFRPACRFLACGPQHPFADRSDQPRLFRDRNELCR